MVKADEHILSENHLRDAELKLVSTDGLPPLIGTRMMVR